MRRWLPTALLCAGFLLPGLAHADEATVGCGETCDSEMNRCLAKCPPPPPGQEEDTHMECQNECARNVFHPCLDKCKHFRHKPRPKPNAER